LPTPPQQALVRVPDLAGNTVGVASSLLRGAQLALVAVDTIEAAFGEGRIDSQSPRAGDLVPVGTGVRVQLSLAGQVPPFSPAGPPEVLTGNNQAGSVQQATLVVVPDLVGLSTAEAESVLFGAGLQPSYTDLVRSEAGVAGTVLAQVPAAGDVVPAATSVNLTAVRVGLGLGRVVIPALGLFLLALGAFALRRRARTGGEVATQQPPKISPRPRLRPVVAAASYELELTGPLFRGLPLHIRARRDRGEIELVAGKSLTASGGFDG
jgi:hypothetical protein